MRTIRNSFSSLAIIGGLIGSLNFVHAQTTTRAVQTVSTGEMEVILQAVEATTPVPAESVPRYGLFYSARMPMGPPLPASMGWPAWNLGNDVWLLDDLDQPQEQMRAMAMDVPSLGEGGGDGGTNGSFTSNYTPPDYGTNLWLEITNIADGAVNLLLHNSQPEVPYELLSKQTLLDAQWVSEGMVTGVDNDILTPATVSIGDRTESLFIRALSWVDSDADGIPDWWMLKYFGHPTGEAADHSLAGDDYDGDGVSNLEEFQGGTNPNKIQFLLQFPGIHVGANPAIGAITILGGVPSYMAVLVNDTNFTTAIWQPYNSNVAIPLNFGDGNYDIWVGLRGLPQDAQQTWQETYLVLDTIRPVITITSPTTSVVSKPRIQVQGYASEPLSSLTFDVSNAAGTITNQQGFLAGQFYDTNLLAFTTNWFQCYDVGLAGGLNTITLHATDLVGNTTIASFDVTLDYSVDTTPPALTVVWPQDGMSIGGDTFTLRGFVDDETAHVAVSGLTANPVDGLVQRDGQFWIANLPLTNGDNTLMVTATDAAGNSTTNNITVFKGNVTLVINPVSKEDLKQTTVTVSGTISDASYDVWVNGMDATVYEDGTWEADNVPVNGSGIAVFDAVAYPPGAAPAAGMLFVARPMGSGGSSDVNQSSVEVMPSLVRIISYQEEYFTAEPPSCSTMERTVAWARGFGGFSRQHSTSCDACDAYVEWPTNWPDGETLDGESCMGYYSESPNPAWQYCSVNQSFSWGRMGDYGPLTFVETLNRDAQTTIELVVGGQVQTNAQQIILLTASAAEYSSLAVNMTGPGPAWWPANAFDGAGDVPLPASAIRILGQTPTPTATNDNVGDLILTLPAGAVRDITPIVFTTNQNYYSFDVQVTDVNLQLAVDANRDGNITFDSQDQTSATNYYRFWVNNDYDGYDSSIGDYADLDPSTGDDANNLTISCTRDLEDYSRLWINTQGITEELQNGTFLLALEWKTVTVGYPGIRIFPAVETNGGTFYLTDEGTAQAQTNAPYGNCLNGGGVDEIQGSLPFILPSNVWANVTADQPVGHFLFDAVNRGNGQLVISIYKNDGLTKLAEGPGVWLDLKDVKEMYERWTVDNGSGTPATTANLVTTPYSYDSTIPAENNYILFVHGWNLAPWERDAFAETAFKRLYWQGYKGHFGAFQWPTGYGFTWESIFTDPRNYDNSESNAWASATGLLGKLNDLNTTYPNHVYLMAHSMGNVVAGEALKQAGSSQLVNTYVAMQGAVPSHGYDPATPNRTSPSEPDCYANYWTNGAPCYFNGTAGAGNYINFYNTNDWALGWWGTDQNLKPDLGHSYFNGQFYRGTFLQTPLYFPGDTYEIFAYCDAAPCFALGAQANVGGAFLSLGEPNQLDLDTTFNFGSLHKGHSAEFNSDNMSRAVFWNTLLDQMGL